MIKGTPYHSAIGHCITKYDSEIQIGPKWYSPSDLGNDAEAIWGERVLDLTSRDDVLAVKFSVTLTGNAKLYRDAYSLDRLDKDCVLAVRIWNKSSRIRRLFQEGGALQVGKGSEPKLTATLTLPFLDLAEFSGEIEIEPVLFARNRLHDRQKSGETFYAEPGMVIAWGDPLKIVLEKSRQGLGTLFEFKFCSFADDTENDLPSDAFFTVKWEPKPILFLDTGVEGLYEVLMSRAKTGKVAWARDGINATIAHGVLSAVLAAGLQSSAKIFSDSPDLPYEDVLTLVEPQERAVMEAWLPFLSVSGGRSEAPEVLGEFLNSGSDERAMLLAERLHDVLGGILKTRDIVSSLISGFGLLKNGDGNGS